MKNEEYSAAKSSKLAQETGQSNSMGTWVHLLG